jgi:hypothetical protein
MAMKKEHFHILHQNTFFAAAYLSIKGLFGASEFSPEWEQVYQIMVGEY